MSGSYGWRPHIESALSLCVSDLFKRGALRPGSSTSGGWQWMNDRVRIASITYSADLTSESGNLRLLYTKTRNHSEPRQVDCIIRLTSLPLNYGGRRWYAHCPYTHQRVLKLYLFDGVDQFCSRSAIHPLPTYASQRTSGTDRIIEQRWALRRRIGDHLSDLFGEPCKPKWMRSLTFERYLKRDAALARAELSSLKSRIGRWQTVLETTFPY